MHRGRVIPNPGPRKPAIPATREHVYSARPEKRACPVRPVGYTKVYTSPAGEKTECMRECHDNCSDADSSPTAWTRRIRGRRTMLRPPLSLACRIPVAIGSG